MDDATLGEYAVQMVQYARAAERILAQMKNVETMLHGIRGLSDLEPGLEPELIVALDHLDEFQQALSRAFTFIDTRLDVVAEKLGVTPPPTEGGTT